MGAVMVNRICSDSRLALNTIGLAVVEVLFEPGIIRTRDLELNTVAFVEHNARRPKIYPEPVDVALLKQCLVIKPVPESGPNR